ncbi:glycoside hydrolase family 16 protein [Dyadobacter psychrotolerans]|uniref:Glycoside hydrolase family 16 protein n=1 Tax=Dyadobacter psychrotolerans TaxID=2541721 RepID=A0A4R5DV98_9BACT|nr:glycoside hydrolase family 16 protein [Dyadobacter psychrotolerans]TDE16454.1 glycoside hydrolase family 16 protein [Dyadobacter psychrotolerans]
MSEFIIKVSVILFGTLLAMSGCAQQVDKPKPAVKYEFGTSPVWQDEFDYSGKPDPQKWNYATGDNGWGNNELQNYTDRIENARVENGNLVITSIKEKSGRLNYSSARLVSKGKGDFLYGKFEIKAKLPQGRGTWPAVWMLGTEKSYGNKGWPDNGEIDIMEHVGFDQNRVHGNIHTKAFNHSIKTNKGNNTLVNNVSSEFHIYACQWTPEYISILVDGVEYFKFANESGYSWEQWPFDKPFHFLLNIAVGGNWGGQKGVDDSIFPQKMEVDYVRVYPLIEKK